eukprot:TRINITY_DN1364_c0_g1_i1.p1 TRINITY_DN1364_c0_g1~~TRINITY_DN1364_c0_g1_i1.p1  ORF type:complete len:502 (+),score=221.81 TRINITY_DN1364_c0_g1_i1:114-1619(+)
MSKSKNLKYFEYDWEKEKKSSSLSAPQQPVRRKVTAEEKKQSEDVVKARLNPSLAFETFAGKIYDSEAVRRQTQARFATCATELTYLPPDSRQSESPFDRYWRLKNEINTFSEEIKTLAAEQEKKKVVSSSAQDISTALKNEVQSLDKTLCDLLNNPQTGIFFQQHLSSSSSSSSFSSFSSSPSSSSSLSSSSMTALMQTTTGLMSSSSGSLAKHTSVNQLISQLQLLSSPSSSSSSSPSSSSVSVSSSSSSSSSLSSSSVSASSSSSVSATSSPMQQQSTTTCELYLDNRSDPKHWKTLAAYEQRVSILEQVVGHPDQASTLFPDVYTGLSQLTKRVDLLDNNKLDHLSRRIRSVLMEFELLENVKNKNQFSSASSSSSSSSSSSLSSSSTSTSVGVDEKVERLYQMMTRWDQCAQQLPLVISRLQSLRELHEESAQSVSRLSAVEKQMDTTQALLEHDKSTLEQVSKSLSTNLTTMSSNMDSLDSRMKLLREKLENLHS